MVLRRLLRATLQEILEEVATRKRYRSGPNEQILYEIIREAKYGVRF